MTVRTLVRWSAISVSVAAVGYLAVLATVTGRGGGDVEGLMLIGLAGGVIMAALRMAFGGPARRGTVPDPFSRDAFSTDTVNIAHVRVAGVGGAGLVIAALVVAAQYQLTLVALTLGLFGGLLGAVAVILIRRLRHS